MHAPVRRSHPLLMLTATVVVLGAVASVLATALSGPAVAQIVARAPATVTGTQMTRIADTLPAGSALATARLVTPRVFVTANRGFALAVVKGVTYPAVTQNGGRVWKTNGPALHLPAAQAPLVVTSAGAAKKNTFFAFGGGQVVDSTIDGGAHWYSAILGDVVLSCVATGTRLTAVAQIAGAGNTAQTLVYVSTDGGQLWHLNQTLGAL